MTSLYKFSRRLTTTLWIGTLVFLAIALTVSPGAINAAIGTGIVAIVMTIAMRND